MGFVQKLLAFTLIAMGSPAVSWPYDIYVYYPTVLSAKKRQEVLKEKLSAAAKGNITVFAKFRDFFDQVKTSSPDMVIAPANFQKNDTRYKPVLRLLDGGAAQFKYLVLGLDGNAKKVSELKVGMVEETGRELLKDYLDQIMGQNTKGFKSVSKPEDLFPLLVFKSVDAILLSPSNFELLKKQYSLKVTLISESRPVDTPMVFVTGQAGDEFIESILKLSPKVLEDLGFSKVEKLGQAGGKK